MKHFFCIINGKVAGSVDAINGDTAWELARYINPNYERLVEALV